MELFPKEKVPFADEFPDIKELKIIVEILDLGGQIVGEEEYSNTNLPQDNISCAHGKLCKGGGLSPRRIASVVVALCKNRQPSNAPKYNMIECNGKMSYRDYCGCWFRIKVTAEYKN